MVKKNKKAASVQQSTLFDKLVNKSIVKQHIQHYPFVSVICPTYNRREFLIYLLYIYQAQDYPVELRELIILDDSPQSNEDIIKVYLQANKQQNIRYYHHPEHLKLGKKRNMLNDLAQGEYIICMDDDDYYPADKISYTVTQMIVHKALLSGSDQIYVWYSKLNKIYKSASFGRHQAPNGTFAYHRSYLKKHRYSDNREMTEEIEFLNHFTVPILQLPPEKTILCISHHNNTYDKDFVMGTCALSSYQLSDLVKDNYLLNYYYRLSSAPITSKINWSFFEKIIFLKEPTDEQLPLFDELISFGLPTERVIIMDYETNPVYEIKQATTHITVLRQAMTEGWKNYLLLDAKGSLVKQEQTVNTMNKLIEALPHINWDVILLGAEYIGLHALKALKGIAKIHYARLPYAYVVNQSSYVSLMANYEESLTALQQVKNNHAKLALDIGWNKLISQGTWLAVYPSMVYLDEVFDSNKEKYIPSTARFFRKIMPEN